MGILHKVRSWLASSPGVPVARVNPRQAFLEEVREILEANPLVSDLAPLTNDYGFEFQLNGKSQQFFLDNIFTEMREISSTERAERIHGIVESLADANEGDVTWEDAQERLVPLLRSSSLFLDAIHRLGVKQHLQRPFAPFLIETVGIDQGRVTAYVTESLVASWGVGPEQVFDAAHRTAENCFSDNDVTPYDAAAPYPIWHVVRDDSYESSRLLQPEWLASFRGKVAGRPVAIVPERSKLIVGGDDEPCLRRLIETAEREYAASARSISPALYTVDDDGSVVPLILPTEHPLANEVALGHVRLALVEYEAQQKVLQDVVGDDVYVAGLMAIRKDDGAPVSIATWSEGVPSLLPKADEIAFMVGPADEQKPEVFRVRWTDVEQLAGTLLELDPIFFPPRWRTKGWPDEVTLAKLRVLVV